MYSLSTSFWTVPRSRAGDALLLGDELVGRSRSSAAGALIVIDVETSPSGMPASSVSMSASESIATPVRPTSPSRARVVRVVAELRRQVERDREARLAAREQVAETRVRLLGGTEAAYWRIVHGRPRYMSG